MERPTAVDKACALLWAVAQREMSGVGISDLATRVGLPKSTAFRLLRILCRNGALEQYGSHYRLGEMFTDRLPVGPEVELVQLALTPFLAELYERTRCTVQLTMLMDAEVVFLNKLHGIHRAPSPSRIGGRAPAHCTSIGKAMLAYDAASAELVCQRGLDRWTDATIVNRNRLWAELHTIRRTHIAVDDGEYIPMVGSIASPIVGSDGKSVAALCITGPRDEVLHGGHETVLLDVTARARRAYLHAAGLAGRGATEPTDRSSGPSKPG